MIGRYISDLDVGDRLGPVEYEITPVMVREYCHGVEETARDFHGTPSERSLVPPTMVHVDKARVLQASCPEGPGPTPRLHYRYDATWHRPLRVGQVVSVEGYVEERYTKKNREYIVMKFEVSDSASGEVFVVYRDTSLWADVDHAESHPGAPSGR